jgi:2-iminoacetate synthase
MDFINEAEIHETLARKRSADVKRVRDILAKARLMAGLCAEEVAELMQIDTPELAEELFATARWVKDEIYGSRLVLFAPLYISNFCANECQYCAFRAKNKALHRRALTQEEIANEVRILVDQGHKRLLMVSGEAYPAEGFDYVLKSIETIYNTKSGNGEIRRVNVNIAPLSVEDFRRLKAMEIGTYQVFQETFHRKTYSEVHVGGIKRNYDWRVAAPDRAMQAGIDDVGVGVLFGLYNWKFEVLALLQNIAHLEETFGVGPHTISVPRIEPAVGCSLTDKLDHGVSDDEFCKLVAILRLAVPYTGIIMSTRETAEVRRRTFALGVSQISGGSRTNPGGYAELADCNAEQFQLGDHRSLDEVVRDVAALGYIPSFCTACYRLGRTGADFMDLAKPGLIKYHCGPNAVSSFLEYLLDYASPETRKVGEELIERKMAEMDEQARGIATGLLDMLRKDKRDVYV